MEPGWSRTRMKLDPILCKHPLKLIPLHCEANSALVFRTQPIAIRAIHCTYNSVKAVISLKKCSQKLVIWHVLSVLIFSFSHNVRTRQVQVRITEYRGGVWRASKFPRGRGRGLLWHAKRTNFRLFASLTTGHVSELACFAGIVFSVCQLMFKMVE